jgi:hypothetical protein
MRRSLLVTAGLALVFALASVNYVMDSRGPWSNRWCDREVEDERHSPAGDLTAKAVLFGCGIVGPGSWTAVAIVKKGRTPTKDDEVLVGTFPQNSIQLRWKGPDRLEIYQTQYGPVSSFKSEHSGVMIEFIRGREPSGS